MDNGGNGDNSDSDSSNDSDPTGTEPNPVIEFPVIRLPGDDLRAVVHPFDVAERVLATAS